MNTASAFARREWGPLYGVVHTALVARSWRAVPLTLVAVGLTAVAFALQHRSWGLPVVEAVGFVRAGDPLWLALLRTPLSPFVPAPQLPVWGALVQILVVFGVAEITLGRVALVVIAYVSTLAGTVYARIGVAVGPDGAFGLPASNAAVVDSGPSAAVVGLALCVCYRYRAWATAALVVAAMVAEVIVRPDLAGKEHLAAVAAAAVLCAADALARGLRHRRARSGAPGRGGPP
ncbi:hypothetical protein [Streptomyces sp. t39]|uniref:hypothetical protein n=1 Tax=Streptomyces sp. t39 TaxID=1828156 RepID=UPI0011CE18F2|nr:hypothetical protein [Streptomyces sp. t39]TXS50852.1 hypothetical protein EAO77_23145 [Streptomyces sp. t39]